MIDFKVVWGEGTLISPQHFQQQERYFETLINNFALNKNHHWGFKNLDFNESAKEMGILEVAQVSGFFKNGLYFEETSQSCPRLKIEIPPNIESETVYLAWSNESVYQQNYAMIDDADGINAQYILHGIELPDATELNSAKRQVVVANKNLRLVLSSQLGDGTIHLPVAKILSSNANGEYFLDKTFIPPFLNVNKNEILANHHQELHGILKQRIQSLTGVLTNPSLMTSNDVRDFLFLQTLNRYQAYMHHTATLPVIHPCELYESWLKLYGDLSTFEPTKMNLALPSYHHDNLKECYAELMALLKQALSIVLEQKAILIPFEMTDETTRVAITPDKSLLNNCRFVLAVNANIQPETLRQTLPATIKIGSVEKIKDLVAYHLPGVKVNALATAPRELPYYAGFSYFELDKTSELWADLHQSSGMALHLAGEFPELQIEFWAIKPVY